MKWTRNELPTNDLNRVNAEFTSSNRVTVTDDRAQSRVDPDTAKLSPFQDVEDIDFEDICDDDAPQLDIVTLRAIAALRSGLDFSKESIPTIFIIHLEKASYICLLLTHLVFFSSVAFILHIFSPPLSVLEIYSRLQRIGAQASVGKI